MAAEDVNRLLAAVIILIVGVGILYAVFSSPELDGMAQESALDMADAINEAANLPVYDGVPDITESDKYVPFIVRFGEPMNVVSSWTMAWVGASNGPTYQIFYEKFPDDKPVGPLTSWTESYPWSGGMAYQLIFYIGIRGFMLGAGATHAGRALGLKLSRAVLTVAGAPFIAGYRLGRWIWRAPAYLALAIQTDDAVYGTWYASRIMKAIGTTSGESLGDKYVNFFMRKQSRVDKLIFLKALADNGLKEASESQNAALAKAKIFYETAHAGEALEFDESGKRVRIQLDYSSLENIKKEKMMRSLMDAGTKAEYYGRVVPPPTETGFRFSQSAAKAKGWNIWKTDGWRRAKWPFQKMNEYGRSAASTFRRGVRSAVYGPSTTITDQTIIQQTHSTINAVSEKQAIVKANEWVPAGIGVLFDEPASVHAIDNFDIIDSMYKNKDIALTFQQGTSGNSHLVLSEHMNKMIGYDEITNNRNLIKQGVVSFEQLADTDYQMYSSFKLMTEGLGLPEDTPNKIWATAQKNYATQGTFSIQAATMEVYVTEATKFGYDAGAGGYQFANPKMAAELTNVVRGNLEVPAGRALLGRRIQRAVLFDLGRYKTPIHGGAWMTQEAQERMTDDVDTDNSLVFATRGAIADVIPLDENVKNYGVKIYRPEPSTLSVKGPQTMLFKWSVVTNPRFYTVSPCFGKGMAWKGVEKTLLGGERERIFIKMFDDDEYMCTGENCKPGVDGECEPEECINYCYATEERLFGGENSPSSTLIHTSAIGPAIGSYLGCKAISTHFGTGIWADKYCTLLGAGVGYGIISGEIALHKDDDACTENYWTYWQWYTAADTMDQLEIMATVGISRYKEAVKAGGTAAWFTRMEQGAVEPGARLALGRRAASYAGRIGSRLITDTSMIPVVLGDSLSSWPNIGKVKYPMTQEHIEKNEAECIWGTPETEAGRKALYDVDTTESTSSYE